MGNHLSRVGEWNLSFLDLKYGWNWFKYHKNFRYSEIPLQPGQCSVKQSKLFTPNSDWGTICCIGKRNQRSLIWWVYSHWVEFGEDKHAQFVSLPQKISLIEAFEMNYVTSTKSHNLHILAVTLSCYLKVYFSYPFIFWRIKFFISSFFFFFELTKQREIVNVFKLRESIRSWTCHALTSNINWSISYFN